MWAWVLCGRGCNVLIVNTCVRTRNCVSISPSPKSRLDQGVFEFTLFYDLPVISFHIFVCYLWFFCTDHLWFVCTEHGWWQRWIGLSLRCKGCVRWYHETVLHYMICFDAREAVPFCAIRKTRFRVLHW